MTFSQLLTALLGLLSVGLAQYQQDYISVVNGGVTQYFL